MNKLNFKKLNGLIPVIIQDFDTDKILMLGFMNEEAYKKTLKEGKVTFFSRTKKRLWTKGESSGNFLKVVKILSDCDNDSLLIKTIPQGNTCHTGKYSCFGEKEDSLKFLENLFELIKGRRSKSKKGSYTSSLFAAGLQKILQKVGEEAVEVIVAGGNETRERLVEESVDLIYHLMVLWEMKNVEIKEIIREMRKRAK